MQLGELLAYKQRIKEKTFVAYITAGDRSLSDTFAHVMALTEAGVDIIELGVPHSDPVADGPTNQLAAVRSLHNSCSLRDILSEVAIWRKNGLTTPLILFTYYNPIFRMGVEEFAAYAKNAGVDGALVVDLPPEEAGDYIEVCRKHQLETVFLASPTTNPSRLELIDASTSAFVYYVSRLGVTGVQTELSSTLDKELAELRMQIKKPIFVGFGISTPEQSRAAAVNADGVIVGSAFVKLIETEIDPMAASKKIKNLATALVSSIKSKHTK